MDYNFFAVYENFTREKRAWDLLDSLVVRLKNEKPHRLQQYTQN